MTSYTRTRKRRRGNSLNNAVAIEDSSSGPRIVEAGEDLTTTVEEPVEVLVQRYQRWKQNGAPHEDTCFTCRKPHYLLYCFTCKRSYHEACLTREPTSFFFHEHFFCDVCIGRKWHQKAPPINSPRSAPRSPPRETRAALPTERVPRPSSPVLRPGTTSPRLLQNRPPLRSSDVYLYSSSACMPQITSKGDSTPPPARSRFSTLSPEVDQAISVILRDLEYLGTERERTKQLEMTIAALQQELQIKDNSLKLAQRSMEMERRKSQASAVLENERLVQQVRDLNRLLETEKAKSAVSQKDMIDAKIETQNAKKELDALRDKLRGLLGA